MEEFLDRPLPGLEYHREAVAKQASVDSVVARAEVAERLRQRRIEAEVDRLEQEIADFGEDDYAEGDVVKFTKQFVPGGKAYLYAAIKANDAWYTTGPKSPKGYSWDEFVLWLIGGEGYDNWKVLEQR